MPSRARCRLVTGHYPHDPEPGRTVDRTQLPDLADARESADVEGVEGHLHTAASDPMWTTLARSIARTSRRTRCVSGPVLLIVVILSLYTVASSQEVLDQVHRIVPNRHTHELELIERTVSHALVGLLRAQVTLVLVQVVLTISAGLIFGCRTFLTGIGSALAMFVPGYSPEEVVATAADRAEAPGAARSDRATT